MTTPDNTGRKQADTQFKPGQSGNPRGRPKGARNKLSEQFFLELYESWQEHGKAAIEKMQQNKPSEYVKLVASLVPKDFNLNTSDSEFDHLTDEQLLQRARALGAYVDDLEIVDGNLVQKTTPDTN